MPFLIGVFAYCVCGLAWGNIIDLQVVLLAQGIKRRWSFLNTVLMWIYSYIGCFPIEMLALGFSEMMQGRCCRKMGLVCVIMLAVREVATLSMFI